MERESLSPNFDEEPQTMASIIVRPAYKANGDIYRTSSTRWIGALYVNGQLRHETTDFDRKGAAYVSIQKAIKRDPDLLKIIHETKQQ